MGEVIAGRYELVDLIGQGAMGSVWEARDLKSGDAVALKVLLQSEAADLLRFVRETSLRFEHDHVVVPLGWVAEDDKVAFAMPLVRGGSLAELMKDVGALPWPFTAEVMRQVAMGLAEVHGAGYVHRDVKPANILLTHTGDGRPHAMLGDFGVAVETDGPRLTRHAAVIGTPGYLAPEAETGAGDVSPLSDLYALGAMGRAMITDVHPTRAGAMGNQPIGVPRDLWLLIGDLTKEDPAKRPGSAEAVLERLADPDLAWRAAHLGSVFVPDRLAGGHGALAVDRTSTGADDGATRHKPRGGRVVAASGMAHDNSDTKDVRRRAMVPEQEAPAPPPWLRPAAMAGLALAGLVAGLLIGRQFLAPTPAAGPSPAASSIANADGAPTGQVAPVWIWRYQRVGGDCATVNVGKYAMTADRFPLVCTPGAGGAEPSWTRVESFPATLGSASPVPSVETRTSAPANLVRIRPDGNAPCSAVFNTRYAITSDGYAVQCQSDGDGTFTWKYLTAYPTPPGEPASASPTPEESD